MSTDPFGLVGQVLDGQFRVEELVGEGGFSAVYRGHHIGLNEPIAIKSLKLPVALQTSLVDTFVQRFRDESRLLYRLSQGNLHIVRSIAAGTTTSQTGVLVPFMVLEWLNGRSLAADFGVRRDLGKQGRSLAEIVQTFATAADALSYAHAQGVVHRDLNPGNFFLATTQQGIKMKVLDFGVAKVMHDSTLGLGPRAQTVGQFRIFAPAYGAPEQFDDALGNVGTASDVYSFALVLLEAMRDAPVNEGQNLADFARFAVDPARRPTPRLFGMQVADEIEAVFARATQLDPKKRWQTAAELWGALTSAVQSAGDKPAAAPARTGVAGPAPKTLPLGATFPFPRPPPRPAAGAPPSSGAKPASTVAKATQRFGNALTPAPGSAPAPAAATMMGLPSSPGAKGAAPPASASPDTSRPTSRPAAPANARPAAPPPSSSGGEEEEGDEPTKVAATDPRILKMAATEAQERDATIAATAPPRTEGERLPFEDEEEELTAATAQPPARLPPSMPPVPAAAPAAGAGARFGDTIAMAEPAAALPSLSEVADEADIERAPDSGGTLIMAPGQTTGAPLATGSSPSSHSSGSMPAAAPPMHGGLGSTLAFSGSGPSPMTPRLSGPAPDAAWPATQLSPGQSQVYPPQPVGNEGFAPGQSQLYAQQQQQHQGYPQHGGGPMYGAQMHSPSMPGGPGMAPPQGYASPAFPAPAEAPPQGGKKTPVMVLALAGGLLVLGLVGIGAFLVVGHDGKGAGAAGSASGAASVNAPPAASSAEPPPPPPVVATAQPSASAVVDAPAPAPAPVAEEPVDAGAHAANNAGASSGGSAPTTAPTYAWPPPATPPTPPAMPTPPAPVQPAHAPTPVAAPHPPTPAPAPVPATPVDPNAWNESAARARLSQANGVLVACRRDGGVSGPGKALVTFASDGTVISVSLDAPYVGTKEGECAARQFQRAKVSPFNGGPQTVKHSFEIPK